MRPVSMDEERRWCGGVKGARGGVQSPARPSLSRRFFG